jgi:hypothetical protein
MSTSTSLFSRARPGKSTPKKVRGFLSLPGELRNEVYQDYFESDFRCEIAAKGSILKERKTRTVKLSTGAQTLKYQSKPKEESPITIRTSRPLGKYTTVKGLQTNWFSSLFAIHLVCKQLHAETLPYIYSTTVFVFDASNRLKTFLNVVSKPKLEHITKLQLHYETYGCPQLLKDRIWQEKHNKSWVSSCASASKELVGLQELKIWIQVRDSPLRFNLRESWVLPLLPFRRLGRTPPSTTNISEPEVVKPREGKLEIVDIVLRSKWHDYQFARNSQLEKACKALHILFGGAIRDAILGAKEEAAMTAFNDAWKGEYHLWQHHLGFAKTGW